MFTFQGQPLLNGSYDESTIENLGALLSIPQERIKELADVMKQAKAAAIESPAEGISMFSLNKLFQSIEVHATTPGELVFVGMCIGRTYAEMRDMERKSAAISSFFGMLGKLAKEAPAENETADQQ